MRTNRCSLLLFRLFMSHFSVFTAPDEFVEEEMSAGELNYEETMSSSDSTEAPLYFFDQPAKQNQVKGTRSHLLYSFMDNGVTEMEDPQSGPENDNKEDESAEFPQRVSHETCIEDKPETSFRIKDHNLMDAYKRAAPVLLNELAHLLSQHNWTEEGRIPHRMVNILNYSWKELTAGAVYFGSPVQTGKWRGQLKSSQALRTCNVQVTASDRSEAEERGSSVGGNVDVLGRKAQVSAKPRMKKRKQNPNPAHSSSTFTFSFPSDSSKDAAGCDLCPGWIIQPKRPRCDEPQRISLCQWVVKRLQAARDPEKLQTAQTDLNQLGTQRHYGYTEAKVDRTARRTARPETVVNRKPQTSEVRQQDLPRQKLLHGISDSSLFIYYPAGRMAVCQSGSGLPCGGFYTNVFSDSKCPVVLATITAFGQGTVSSAVTAVWDQDGGFMSDQYGNVTQEWGWREHHTPRKKIVIQVSDLITVRLHSGTSSVLCFKSDGKSAQLPLSALPSIYQPKTTPCLQTKEKFRSDFARELLQKASKKYPAVFLESESNPTLSLTPMVREAEEPEEPTAQLRRGGRAGRELKRLQQRVRNIISNWLQYYRSAIGIKCPGVKRMPDALLRTRLRKEVKSAVLPSLNPPERADAELVQLEDGRSELQKLHRHLSAPAQRPSDTRVKLPRMSERDAAEMSRMIEIAKEEGLMYDRTTFKAVPDDSLHRSVVGLNSPDLEPSDVFGRPATPSLTPSTPLTVCPAQLRSALLGEKGSRRCCCSATLMPPLTDVEYDAFITGQPQHSQQILVVCVTHSAQRDSTQPPRDQVVLEQLYRRRNKHRTMPCTQCQMDSFRLLRYEMSTRKSGCEEESLLLQQRHNAAPGMVLVSEPTAGRLQMYLRGKLLFVGHIFSDHSCSVRDLENQISRSRGDYRLGLSLPLDYKFRDPSDASAEKDENSQSPKEDQTPSASAKTGKFNQRKNNQVSLQEQKNSLTKSERTPALPRVSLITN